VEAVRTSCANKSTLHYEQLQFQYMSVSPEGLSFLCHFRNAHFPRTDNRSARKTGFDLNEAALRRTHSRVAERADVALI
jgi:hypothetical protein